MVELTRDSVENNASQIDTIVNEIIKPYCSDLDNYVKFVASCLRDGQNPLTTAELEDVCMNLSTYIYFAGGMCESLGIRDDIAKALYKEMYHNTRNSQNGGTVADKDSIAELASQAELLTSVCYTRAYRIVKAKVENAQELLQSAKKVLTNRMTELELTKLDVNNRGIS